MALVKEQLYLFHQILSVIKSLCGMNACRYELEQITGGGFQSRRPPKGHSTGFSLSNPSPSKMIRTNDSYRGPPNANSGNYSGGNSNFGGGRDYPGRGYNRGYKRGYGMRDRDRNWSGKGEFHGRYFHHN